MNSASMRNELQESRLDSSGPGTDDEYDESAHVLVVDDDPDVRQALETYFHLEGCSVTLAENGKEALEALAAEEPVFDLVLLDVVLPEINGFEVLRQSQEMGATSPVLMMSGRGDQENILKGFGLGAQDYIIKPFDAEDLVNRTKRLLGRRQDFSDPLTTYELGDLRIDFYTEQAMRNDEPVPFTEMELDLLRCLIKNRGYVVTKKRLLREAWQIDDDLIAYTINPDIAIERVDESIASIRDKIEADPKNPSYIETVYGLGYRFRDWRDSTSS